MHFCHEEVLALIALLPFMGAAVVKVRGWWHARRGCSHGVDLVGTESGSFRDDVSRRPVVSFDLSKRPKHWDAEVDPLWCGGCVYKYVPRIEEPCGCCSLVWHGVPSAYEPIDVFEGGN